MAHSLVAFTFHRAGKRTTNKQHRTDVSSVAMPGAFHEAGMKQPLLTKHVADTGMRLELACLFVVCLLEGADTALLPSVLFALQSDLGLDLQSLAMMGMCQAVASALFGPVWGILADRGVASKRALLISGCVVQGLITMLLAHVSTIPIMLALRILNGAALASLGPVSKSMVAEDVASSDRGKIFSLIAAATNVGNVIGAFVGVQLASREVFGWQGWRVAFMVMGSLGVLAGGAAFFGLKIRAVTSQSSRTLVEELTKLRDYLNINSFRALVIQGCFGSMPWAALGYATLFFQTAGLSTNETSALVFAFQASCMAGTLIGGVVGDTLEASSPGHGRPLTAQISVGGGLPIVLFVFLAPPMVGSYFYQEMFLVVALGLVATWCGAGVNAPILCELVDISSCAGIMAWEAALEGSFANFFGNMFVGLLGQVLFGYRLSHDNQPSPSNKTALGKALAVSCVLPWLLCFVVYIKLHRFYPEDLQNRTAHEGSKSMGTQYGVVAEVDDNVSASVSATAETTKGKSAC